MRTMFSLLAALVILSTAAFAFPGMSGHWTMSVSPGSATASATVTHSDTNGLQATYIVVKMHGNAYGIPVAMHHMRVRRIFAPSQDSNTLTIEVNTPHGPRDFNVMAPPIAVQRVSAHIAARFHASIDQNALMSRMRLSECQEFNASSGLTYRPCYVAPVKVRARILGIFPVTTTETVQVDAETGKVHVRAPWWSFLVFGKVELLS